jgi:hypothetical protein
MIRGKFVTLEGVEGVLYLFYNDCNLLGIIFVCAIV